MMPPAPEVGDAAPDLCDYAAELPVLADMLACPQDPHHHGEGDVLTHTQMVCEQLVSSEAWQQLGREIQEELWWAAVLHDCAKPITLTEQDGRLSNPHHASKGAVLARRLLWQSGIAPDRRERVCGLIRWHMLPYRILERPNSQQQTLAISWQADTAHLHLLALSDSRGRACKDQQEVTERVEMFAEYCREQNCLGARFAFGSDHARVQYFQRPDRDPSWPGYDDTRCQLTLMVGLPGAGKDHWIAENARADEQIVSLDALRQERKVKRGDKKAHGQVISQARQMLRDALGQEQDVIYNATNLSSMQREPILALAHDYNARIRVVMVEAGPEALQAQNARRSGLQRVPADAIEALLARWDPPTLCDAHELLIVHG